MAGGPRRAREARGRAGAAQRGGQEEAARAPLGAGREGVRIRYGGREEDARRAVRRPLAAPRLQRHVRPRLREWGLPRLQQPRGRARRCARPPESPRRDPDLLLAGADRAPDRVQAADGLAVPVRLHLRQRLRVRLRPRADQVAGTGDPRGEGAARRPARLAPGMVGPDRGGAERRAAGGSELDRLRARERHRLPHLHGDRARSVRRALLELPARANPEEAARRAPRLAEGRVPRVNVLAARSRTSILLVAGAAVAWAVSVERMRGMDAGPGTDLGGLGWYLGIWVTMTAAMMLPSAAPAAGHVARLARRSPTLLFVPGYLAVWTVYGLAAYGLYRVLSSIDTGWLAWDERGPWVAGAVIVVAGIYELTPLKRRSLRRCRRAGHPESALRSALAHGLDCVGCSGGLMAVLFVLGVMSLFWMGLVAVAIFAAKVRPQGARLATPLAVALAALGIWVGVSPARGPRGTQPGGGGPARGVGCGGARRG